MTAESKPTITSHIQDTLSLVGTETQPRVECMSVPTDSVFTSHICSAFLCTCLLHICINVEMEVYVCSHCDGNAALYKKVVPLC